MRKGSKTFLKLYGKIFKKYLGFERPINLLESGVIHVIKNNLEKDPIRAITYVCEKEDLSLIHI